MKWIFLFWVLFLIPSVFAFDCSITEDIESCEYVQSSGITQENKELLYEAMLYQEFPDFDFVFNYNTQLDFSTPPRETGTYNGKYVRNAWIKIIDGMPSILIDETLFHNGEGNILSAYNQDIELPRGTARGDCKTIYNIKNKEVITTAKINGQNVDYSRLIPFSNKEDILVEVKLRVSVDVEIEHYREKKVGERYECKYSHSQTDKDEIIAYDFISLTYYSGAPKYQFKIIDDSYRGLIEVENTTGFDLSFDGVLYKNRDWFYTYEVTDNILQIKSDYYNTAYSKNIHFNDNIFVTPTIENCTITLYTHFSNEEYTCNTEFDDLDLKITLDKTYYKSDDHILVNIDPPDEEAIITYKDFEEVAVGSISIPADKTSQITATSGFHSDTKLVYVQGDEWSQLADMGWIGAILYSLSQGVMFFGRKFGL